MIPAVSVVNDLAAQHSNTCLLFAVAVQCTFRNPPPPPAPPVQICYGVIHVCSYSSSMLCVFWQWKVLYSTADIINSSRPNTLTLSYSLPWQTLQELSCQKSSSVMKLKMAQASIGPLHAVCKQSHQYQMTQADWSLLILQPMRSLAQHLIVWFSVCCRLVLQRHKSSPEMQTLKVSQQCFTIPDTMLQTKCKCFIRARAPMVWGPYCNCSANYSYSPKWIAFLRA